MNADVQNDNATAEAMLNIFDGDGQQFSGALLVRVHNVQGQTSPAEDKKGPAVLIKVPFHDGPGDFYAVSVSAPGYKDTGCFFKANPKVLAVPKVLMLRNNPTAQFPHWAAFKATHPDTATFLGIGADEASAQAHYDSLAKSSPDSLASLLNLIQAMREIDLGGKTPLDFFKEIRWDYNLAQDRFFAYADPAIIPLIRSAAEEGAFAEEKDCAQFHKGSTHSWKQVAFPVANVQLTFHENDTKMIGDRLCVMIEPDIDLYKDLVEHGFGEVFPNLLTGSLTNPFAVYSMRWATANDDSGPAFDPGYTLA